MRLIPALFTLLAVSALQAQGPADKPPVPLPPPGPPGAAPGLPGGPSTPTPGLPQPAPEQPSPPGGPKSPSGAQPAPAQPTGVPPVAAKPDDKLSVIRVNVTNQPWDFMRPWGKRAPYSRRAIGAVVAGKRVLVTAELVANANYVELETADGSIKVPATIETVDYEANLAMLKPEDDQFLDAFRPAEFTTATVGDALAIWQLESTGTLLVTRGSMTTAEVSRYPVDESPLLVYRVAVSLQFRDSSFTLPVAKDDKLVGLVMRYDNSSKSAEIVPTPIIEHFLKDAGQPPYEGFVRTGLAYSSTRDPQLRRFLGLGGETAGGVYVTDILKDGPAEKAGIEKGDVILRIGGEAVDQDGNYSDPLYGKLALTHLIGARQFHGDAVKFTLFRKGQSKTVEVQVAHRDVEQFVIEPYVIDRAPRFYVLGGLVLQELSRQFLKEWGPDWLKKAPEELVFLDRYQNELFKDGPKKVVMLGSVLPSPATIGYEDLRNLVVTKINGTPLETLTDVPAALGKSTDGLHKIEFSEDPSVVYLDATEIAEGDEALAKNYRLPMLKQLD